MRHVSEIMHHHYKQTGNISMFNTFITSHHLSSFKMNENFEYTKKN